MLKHIQNTKTITIKIDSLIAILNVIKKRQKNVTMVTDYNTKTMHIKGDGFIHTIEGF